MKEGECQLDYHDFVIRDGQFVGRFDEMYQLCEDPWPESENDYLNLPTTSRVPQLLVKHGVTSAFSLGCGTGRHLAWLKTLCPGISFSGSDISPTAISLAASRYPTIKASVGSVGDFVRETPRFDCLILREVLWYILSDWRELVECLHRSRTGCFVALELSTYDTQDYGRDFFDGPEGLVDRFPFEILEVVRWHTSSSQKVGHILIWGQVGAWSES